MKYRAFISLISLVILSLACNAPVSNQPANTAQPGLDTGEIPPAPTEPPAAEVVPTKASTPTLPPVDITFSINCDALDSSFQADCDEYIAVTAEQVYPILRQITGVSLGECFSNINYTIVVGDAADGAGGQSDGSEITYSKTYSIELAHKYDVHELIHSISRCAGALDGHVFHGMLQNTVYARLGVFDPGSFSSRQDAADLNSYLSEALKTSSGNDVYDQCRGFLVNSLTIAYFDIHDKSAVTSLYRATINPQPVTAPNEKLKTIWGNSARKVQALLEILEQKYNFPIDVTECGY